MSAVSCPDCVGGFQHDGNLCETCNGVGRIIVPEPSERLAGYQIAGRVVWWAGVVSLVVILILWAWGKL